jgi:hypothetical protein
MKQNRKIKKKFLDFGKLTTSVLGKTNSLFLQDSSVCLIRMDIVITIKCWRIFRVRWILKEITLRQFWTRLNQDLWDFTIKIGTMIGLKHRIVSWEGTFRDYKVNLGSLVAVFGCFYGFLKLRLVLEFTN